MEDGVTQAPAAGASEQAGSVAVASPPAVAPGSSSRRNPGLPAVAAPARLLHPLFAAKPSRRRATLPDPEQRMVRDVGEKMPGMILAASRAARLPGGFTEDGAAPPAAHAWLSGSGRNSRRYEFDAYVAGEPLLCCAPGGYHAAFQLFARGASTGSRLRSAQP